MNIFQIIVPTGVLNIAVETRQVTNKNLDGKLAIHVFNEEADVGKLLSFTEFVEGDEEWTAWGCLFLAEYNKDADDAPLEIDGQEPLPLGLVDELFDAHHDSEE